MTMFGWIKIRPYERGLVLVDGEPVRALAPGWRFVREVWRPLADVRVRRLSVLEVWVDPREIELIARTGVLGDEARVVDLGSHERAVVWADGRAHTVLGPGLRMLWTVFHDVRVEVFDAREVRFEHPDLAVVAQARGADRWIEVHEVQAGWAGLLYRDGRLAGTLAPGQHGFWQGEEAVRVAHLDLREQVLDVQGQEIMTADKVTLRLNALVIHRVTDPEKAVTEVDDHTQALYRQAQLALRALVGTRELDALLADKDGVARELEETLRARAARFGVEVASAGIRDVILPGEMKEILNRVTEARKAAEAALVTRREETAAMRSQANTAKIFESNPTLMKLRELEVLEKVAEKSDLTVVLGDGGLAERVVKML
jgi:regulator of protease activity HflC (stomatin/prohibitin superfamily)